MPTGEPRYDWSSPELWQPVPEIPAAVWCTEPMHECRLAYTHVYNFKWPKETYTKVLLLKCTDPECKLNEPLLIDKQTKTAPRFW